MNSLTNCKDCTFWCQEDRKDKKIVGQCKVDGPQMGPNGYGYWPITGAEEGCFKGKQKEKPMLTEDEVKVMVTEGSSIKP